MTFLLVVLIAKKLTAILDMWNTWIQINMVIQMHYHCNEKKKSSTFDHLNSQRIIFTVYFYNAYLLLNRVPINYIRQLQQLAVLSFVDSFFICYIHSESLLLSSYHHPPNTHNILLTTAFATHSFETFYW